MNSERDSEIIRRLQGGASFQQAADAMGLTKGMVAGVAIRNAGLVPRRADNTERNSEIVRRLRAGHRRADIARDLGVTIGVVYQVGFSNRGTVPRYDARLTNAETSRRYRERLGLALPAVIIALRRSGLPWKEVARRSGGASVAACVLAAQYWSTRLTEAEIAAAMDQIKAEETT
jgi:DNA-binding CsgD family transcriptional regulator